jgi:HK97 family phage major capsid protein
MEEKEILNQIEVKFKEMTKGFANDNDLKNAVSELKAEYKQMKADSELASEEKYKALEDILAKQGSMLQEMKAAKATNASSKSLKEQVEEIIANNQEGFKSFVNKSAPFRMNLKAAGVVTYGNITNSTTLLPMPSMIPGYNPYAWNPATFWDYAGVQTTTSARIAYVDEVSPDGTPITTAEGVGKPQVDWDNKVSYSSAVKVAAYVKVSDEMLDDVSFMATQIDTNLNNRVRLAVSGNIYTYITGLSGILTAVDSTLSGLGGANANLWQLIVAAQQTIAKSNKNCTHIFLNPTDYARLLMMKGLTEQPIIISATSMMVNGITVVSSNAVTVDKYIACDMSKLNVYEYKALSVEMGWDSDDFTKNLRTFVGETRVHYFIKDNDKTAFLYGDITDDLTTLTA